jgi:predicted TIM-barrel fold metal-dependent hydrolase
MGSGVIDAHMHVIPAFFGERNGTTLHGCGYGKVRYSVRGDWRPGAKRGERRVMPPSFVETTATPAVAMEYMDWVGVESAVLMQSLMYGDHNEYAADLIRQHPTRFIAGFAVVDPRDGEAALEKLDWVIKDLGLLGAKLEPPDMPFWLDDPKYSAFWKRMENLGAILSIDLGWDPPSNPYNFQIDQLRRVLERCPALRVLVQHLGVSYLWDERQSDPFPELQRTLALKRFPNVWFDITGLPEFCPDEEYPFPRAQRILEVAARAVGVERIIWGSDFPAILGEDVTYRQCLNLVQKNCPFLSKEELGLVLGKNVLRLIRNVK